MTDSKLAKLIIRRYKERYPRKDWTRLFKPGLTICDLFLWSDTKEGSAFWADIDCKLGYNLYTFLRRNYPLNTTFIDLYLYI